MAELNINDILGKVLENPDAIGKVLSLMNSPEGNAIGSMLGSMLGGGAQGAEGTSGGDGDKERQDALPAKADPSPPKRDEAACRVALLKALMPYLNESRRGKVEYIMKLLQVMQMVSQSGLLQGGLLKS